MKALRGNGKLALFFILLAALFNFALSFTQSIRLDESQSLWVATKSIPGILAYIAQDVHVPLYAILLHFWLQVFGQDIIMARGLSLLFYILTLFTLYKLSLELSTRRMALLAVMLFSLSPFIDWYSSEARMYTLFTFVVCLNHLYFLRVIRSSFYKGKLGYIVSSILGSYTHYFFLILLFSQGIYFFVRAFRVLYTSRQKKVEDTSDSKSLVLRQLIIFLGLWITILICFLPWILFVLQFGGASNTQPLLTTPSSYTLLQLFTNFIFGFLNSSIQAVVISLWPIIIIPFFYMFTRAKRLPIQFVFYLTFVSFFPIILVFIISHIRPIFLSRYLILTAPTLYILLAWLLLSYTKRLFSKITFAIVSLMVILLVYQHFSTTTVVKEDYDGVSAYLTERVRAQDIVAVSVPFTIYPIEYLYTGKARVDTIPEWNRYVEGSIQPFTLENLQAQLEVYKQKYLNLYLVFSYDQGYQDDIRKYLDAHFEVVEVRDFPPSIELRVYKLRYL